MNIKYVKMACEMSCKILKECIDNFYLFKTEKDVADWLRDKAKQTNYKLAFNPLIVSGNNFLEIHHKPDKTKLRKFVIVDFGVKYKGYCSDVTRMIYIGKPSREELGLYKLVRNVQEYALNKLVIGSDYCDADLKARIKFGEYKKYFEHSLGHGIGKKIHKKPLINFRSKYIVKENDVVTIEPGIYTKKFGMRIEDTILIKKNKVEILTPLSKELIILD